MVGTSVNQSFSTSGYQLVSETSISENQLSPERQWECNEFSLLDNTLYSSAKISASFSSLGTAMAIDLKCVTNSSLVPIAIERKRLNSAPEFLFANPSATCAGIPLPHFLHWYIVSFSL